MAERRASGGDIFGQKMAGLSYEGIVAQAAACQLEVLGGFLAEDDPTLPKGTRTLVMLGPLEPGFWPAIQASEFWGGPDPVDRWSRQVVGTLACDLGAKALFPFGGP